MLSKYMVLFGKYFSGDITYALLLIKYAFLRPKFYCPFYYSLITAAIINFYYESRTLKVFQVLPSFFLYLCCHLFLIFANLLYTPKNIVKNEYYTKY